MGKARVATKAKKRTVIIDLDVDVVDALEDIAALADTTPSQVVSVMLATFAINDKNKRVYYPDEPSVELWTLDKDRKIKKQKIPTSQYSDKSFGLGGK